MQVSSNWRWADNIPASEQKALSLAASQGSITSVEVITLLKTALGRGAVSFTNPI